MGRRDLSDGAGLITVLDRAGGVVPFEFEDVACHGCSDDLDDGSPGRIGR